MILPLPLIAIGALVYFFCQEQRQRNVGLGLLGFGMLLFGLSIMSDAPILLESTNRF